MRGLEYLGEGVGVPGQAYLERVGVPRRGVRVGVPGKWGCSTWEMGFEHLGNGVGVPG